MASKNNLTSRDGLREFASNLKETVSSFIKIPEDTMNQFLACAATRSKTLLWGNAGSGKSSIVEVLVQALGVDRLTGDYRVNGTMATSEGEIGAEYDISQLTAGKRVVVVSKFVEAMENKIALFDEIEKANPYTLHMLLSVMAEGILKLGTFTRPVKMGSFFATMNPPEPGEMGHDLIKAMKDRFDAILSLDEPEADDQERILRSDEARMTAGLEEMAVPVVGTMEDFRLLQNHILQNITLTDNAYATLSYAIRSTQFCAKHNRSKANLRNFPVCCANCDHGQSALVCMASTSLSMRAAKSVKRVAKGIAFFKGDPEVTEKHIQAAMPICFRHRLKFPNAVVEDEVSHINSFVKNIMTTIEKPVRIRTNPAAFTKTQIDEFENQGGPLVAEAVKSVKAKLREEALKARATLGTMTSAQLEKAKRSLSAEEVELINTMLNARCVIEIEIEKMHLLDEPSFRKLFTSPEGEPLIASDEAWETLLAEGELDASETLSGLSIAFHGTARKGRATITYHDPSGADLFRESLGKALPEGATLVEPYQGIRAELKKAGVVIPEKEEKAKGAPAKSAPAPGTAQAELF